jgi:hypothetical protein
MQIVQSLTYLGTDGNKIAQFSNTECEFIFKLVITSNP